MGVRGLAFVGPLLVAACSLTTSLTGLSGGDGPGALDGDAAGVDAVVNQAPISPSAPIGQPVLVAQDVGGLFASGAAQQAHLQFAKNAAQWVLFYETDADPDHLRTRVSKDFATWTDGTALALPQPHPHDGRSFAVSYSEIAGRDVFHLAISLKPGTADRRHHHVRAGFDGQSLVFDAMTELGRVTSDDSALDPDGPAVGVLAGGTVIDIAGWYSVGGGTSRTGNLMSWVSSQNDTAASWPVGFAPPVEVEVVDKVCNARALVPLPTGALALWEAGDNDPIPTRLTFARFENGAWSAPDSAGFVPNGFDPNDWSAAAIGAEVHAVRAASPRVTHRVYADGQWGAGSAIPERDHPGGQGLVVLAQGAVLLALILDADGTIASTSLVSGAWSPWSVEVPARPRIRLSGYAGIGGVAAVWIEQTATGKDLYAARLR